MKEPNGNNRTEKHSNRNDKLAGQFQCWSGDDRADSVKEDRTHPAGKRKQTGREGGEGETQSPQACGTKTKDPTFISSGLRREESGAGAKEHLKNRG